MIAKRLKNLRWQEDRMILGDLVFRLEHFRNEDWDLGAQCLNLYKTSFLIDQYIRFFEARPGFRPNHLLELGIWDWGSPVFWFECLEPVKYVGVDCLIREETDYVRAYLDRRGIRDRLVTYWKTGQDDEAALGSIIECEFGGTLDLIIDDASHMYSLSKRSFEILFSYLRPGGFYIIEDWAWAHWKDYDPGPNALVTGSGLTPLIYELVDTIGTSAAIVSEMVVNHGFVAVQRTEGASPGADPGFRLADYIYRRSGFETWPPEPQGLVEAKERPEVSCLEGKECGERFFRDRFRHVINAVFRRSTMQGK